jgi:hypothetical protein
MPVLLRRHLQVRIRGTQLRARRLKRQGYAEREAFSGKEKARRFFRRAR